MMAIFRGKKEYRNYRICRKGTIAGWIVGAAALVIFLLMLLLVLR